MKIKELFIACIILNAAVFSNSCMAASEVKESSLNKNDNHVVFIEYKVEKNGVFHFSGSMATVNRQPISSSFYTQESDKTKSEINVYALPVISGDFVYIKIISNFHTSNNKSKINENQVFLKSGENREIKLFNVEQEDGYTLSITPSFKTLLN